MRATAGRTATVEVAHESRARRIGPEGPADGPVALQVRDGDPLRMAVLVGREPALSRAARRGALAAAAELAALLPTDDARSFVERAAALREARPGLVLVVSARGADAEPLADLVESLRLGCAAQDPPPAILVCGDLHLRARVAAACGPWPVEVLPDPRTPAGRDALVSRARAARRRAADDVILRDEALEAAARAVSAQAAVDAMVVDVTGATTSIVHARPDGEVIAAHVRLGVGASADRVVARAGLDRVRRWIPWPVEGPVLLERVFNRARWPDAVPATVTALALEMSLLREAVTHALADARAAGILLEPLAAPLVVLTGRAATLPRGAQSLLVAIDALELASTSLVSRERDDAFVAEGALAARGASPEAPSATLEPLALVAAMWPRRSATLHVRDARGTVDERVARGAFFVVPTEGAVEISASGAAVSGRGEDLTVGVVVDARGRPLELPPRDAERIPTLARWYGALDALPAEA